MRRLQLPSVVLGIIPLALAVAGASCSAASSGPGTGQGAGGSSAGGAGAGGDDGTYIDPATGVVIEKKKDAGVDQPGPDGGKKPSSGPKILSPVSIDKCPQGLSAADYSALQQAKSSSAKLLYPFDRTVFPRDLPSPTLQWTGGAQAIYLHLKSQLFEYKGCFPGVDPGRLRIPQDVWDTATYQSKGQSDPLTLELAVKTAGGTSLMTQSYTVALGTLRGTVYYNTYDSALTAVNGGTATGAILRIKPGAEKPELFLSAAPRSGDCVGCHSVSANGRFLIDEIGTLTREGRVYDLVSNPAPNSTPAKTGRPLAGMSAVYPDGSRFMTAPYVLDKDAWLVDSKTYLRLPASGWDGVFDNNKTRSPVFSPDGTKFAFAKLTGSQTASLEVMDFDASKNAFSNPVEAYAPPQMAAMWPFFTPDSKNVVFCVESSSDYKTTGDGNLNLLSVASKTVTPLDLLNGISGGQSYLPGSLDKNQNFYPTVSPVASGGYAWIYFSSKRDYGNIIQNIPHTDTKAKKIWVAALDLSPTAGKDPSHPAFYLPGQELESGNTRAFATLDICKKSGEGSSCDSGTDCCDGYCCDGVCSTGVCGKEPENQCSKSEDKCKADGDCCSGQGLRCIGGFCSPEVH